MSDKITELQAQGHDAAPCPHCQAICVWAYHPNGTKIPMSIRIPVYTPVKFRGEYHASKNELSFASHYFDCPQREKFKK